MDNLDLRSALPMSDEEIRRLYAEATNDLNTIFLAGAEQRMRRRRLGWILVCLLIFLFSAEYRFPAMLPMLVIVAMIVGPYLSEFSERVARRVNRTRELKHLNVRNPKILRTVVDYVKSRPLKTSKEIKARIEKRRADIGQAAIRLSESITKLNERLEQPLDTTVRLLMESKRATALETIKDLQKADATLERRMMEADKIVRPVQEMAAHFELLWDISTDVDIIRTAGELAQSVNNEAEDHLIELSYLSFSASEAMEKLAGLQNTLDSEGRARIEVASWTDDEKAAYDTLFPKD